MIKIQKKDFNIDEEIKLIKDKYSNIGAVNYLLDMSEITMIIKM